MSHMFSLEMQLVIIIEETPPIFNYLFSIVYKM